MGYGPKMKRKKWTYQCRCSFKKGSLGPGTSGSVITCFAFQLNLPSIRNKIKWLKVIPASYYFQKLDFIRLLICHSLFLHGVRKQKTSEMRRKWDLKCNITGLKSSNLNIVECCKLVVIYVIYTKVKKDLRSPPWISTLGFEETEEGKSSWPLQTCFLL